MNAVPGALPGALPSVLPVTADLLAEALADLTALLDQARLPLHILLDNRFGDLNENQEEMLGAAQTAVERVDTRLRRLRELIDLDRGAIAPRRDAIPTSDLITSLLPSLKAKGDERGVRVTADLAPALPRVIGDRARLQNACDLLLTERVDAVAPGGTMTITAESSGDTVCIEITHGGAPRQSTEEALARRLIAANGGIVREAAGRTTITLPAANLSVPR